MTVHRIADLIVASSEPLPELASSSDAPDVNITWTTRHTFVEPRWFHAWPAPDGETWVRFGRSAQGYHIDFPEIALFVVSADAARVDAAPNASMPIETVRHLLLNQVLPLLLSRRGRLVIHGSGVTIDGGVVAFVGRTGAGKSTLAAACCAAGAELVTDDALVVTATADPATWLVVPSYSGLRLWQSSMPVLGWTTGGSTIPNYSRKLRFGPEPGRFDFASAPRPLRRVVILEDDGTGDVWSNVVNGHRAALMLAMHLFRLDIEDVEESVRLFDAVSRLAPAIAVARFNAARPTEAASVILPALFDCAPLRR